MVFALFVLSFFVSSLGIHCPQWSWADYKNVKEGSWSFDVPSSTYDVKVLLTRHSNYKCNSNSISFESRLWQSFTLSSSSKSDYYNFDLFPENNWRCSMECDIKLINIIVKYQTRSKQWGSWTEWSSWVDIDEFPFLNKNCEKLYWTSWVETSNCKTSAHSTFTRNCMDCYNDTINQRYCNGSTTKQVSCQPLWSDWGEAGNCISPPCNTTGEQTRTRKCLYGDGSEASSGQLCSEGSPNMTESCVTNNTMNICNTDISTDGTVESNSGLYIGIGVAGILLVILSVSLVISIHRRCEKDLSNQTDNLNSDRSRFDSAVALPDQVVEMNSYEITPCSGNNPVYSTVLPKSRRPVNTNQATDRSHQASVVAGSEISGEGDLFDQVTTSTAEANVYDIATTANHDTACSIFQTVPGKREVSDNLYHNMPGPDDVAQENDYSTLSAR